MPGALGQLDLFWFSVLIVSCVAFYMVFWIVLKCVFFLVKVEALHCLILIDIHESCWNCIFICIGQWTDLHFKLCLLHSKLEDSKGTFQLGLILYISLCIMAASLQSHFSICSSPFDMEECVALIFNSLTQAENRQNTALCQKKSSIA